MLHDVTDDEKEAIYEEFGKPPVREEPLDVERYNFVLFCDVGGPIYAVRRGRVFRTGMAEADVRRKKGGPAGDDGAIERGGPEYVNVRYGTATMHSAYIPVEYVLRIEAPGCEWVSGDGGRGYRPLDQRVNAVGRVLD